MCRVIDMWALQDAHWVLCKKKNLSAGRLPRKKHDAMKTSKIKASFDIAITEFWIMSLATFLDDVLVLEALQNFIQMNSEVEFLIISRC